ncbi:hypothetical protein EMIT0232MI5_10075 [Pseudomonas sp. IT-232MI5]
MKPCANWLLESVEFGLIIGFLFSADRHLSELTPANEHDRCLLNFPKEARSTAAVLINPMIWMGLF